jgi:hypothetical protein
MTDDREQQASRPWKGFEWFPRGGAARKHKPQRGPWLSLMIGLGVGAALFLLDRPVLALVAWTVSVVLAGASFASARAGAALQALFARLGEWLGRLCSFLLLTPLYLTVFTATRVLSRISGTDRLQLRDSDGSTFWLSCDLDRRKLKYVRSMFATERVSRGGHRGLVVAGVLAVLMLGAEAGLRLYGFGRPILYVSDPQVGYYPAPNQDVTRYGGRIVLNSLGMRAPEFSLDKRENTFRVLMLGDSTLWGGSYVDQNDLYARLLEQRLNRGLPGRRVEVLNMGVNAWGPFHELGYVEKFGTFGADVAVICLPVTDIYRGRYGLESLPLCSRAGPPRLAFEELFWHLTWRYRAGRLGASRLTSQEVQEQEDSGIEAYGKLARTLRDAGCEVLVEILPSRAAGIDGIVAEPEGKVVRRIQESLAAAGFPAHFPAGLFRGQGEAGDLYHDDCHLHWKGHRVYAQYLAEVIGRDSLSFRRWSRQEAARLTKGGG